MYPNLYYVFRDWFGVKWVGLSYLNTFGLMVAVAFFVGGSVLVSELKRKEKEGLLIPNEESVVIGKPASAYELLINFLLGFVFGYKLLGLFFSKPNDIPAQAYIFSRDGSVVAGLLLGIVLAGLKWWEKDKQKTKEPEEKKITVWPHDRVGDILIIALVAGILGAKLFDNLENWNDFIQHPIERMFSASGLTFYGGLIVASLSIAWYGIKRKIKLIHLADAFAPALLIGYAVGRIGCQVAGDGDWGIFNSAYITNPEGKVVAAKPGDYQLQLDKYHTYFLNGVVLDSDNVYHQVIADTVTDRISDNLADVPNKAFKAPSFIPTWMVAYNYPGNVNKDGFKIPGDEDEHNRVLPIPVFPTPFYEIISCGILFFILWGIRKKVKTAGVISGIYLILNGMERFTVEKIRVNNRIHNFLGSSYNPTQAELISFGLIIFGAVMILICLKRNKIKTIEV
jgi:phosphatidylglycerol---prolipoprotein diacylglyceryl transferase